MRCKSILFSKPNHLKMRKLYLLFFLAFSSYFLSAQHLTYDIGRWTLGGNIGGTYQKADVSNRLFGLAYGATLEYRLYNKRYRFFNFSLRGRYLKGETFGLGYQPHESFISNYALNGFGTSGMDYSKQLFFQNNNTELEELSLEAMLRWNKLYENIGILFYLFAGAGGTDFVVNTNQLDEFDNMYDYSLINYESSKSDVRKQLRDLMDDSYETQLDNKNYRRLVFTPSVGVGLGFRISPGVDFAMEHKISLPQTDYFDGQATKNNTPFFIKDIYHYTSLGIKLNIIKHHKEDVSYTSPTTPTYTTPTTVAPTNVVITVQSPTSTGFITPNCVVEIKAKIKPAVSKQNVTFYQNNKKVEDYRYTVSGEDFKAVVNLEPGTNTFKISAQHTSGIATKELVLNCADESKITICHQLPGGQFQTMEIKSSEWAMHQAHGDTKGACQQSEKMITICHNVVGQPGVTETIQIPESQWTTHKAHGDAMGACVPQQKSMITICYNNQTIEIEESQWPSYQSQGARKGACYTVKKITICHVPATGDKRQTIEIPESEWAIHQAHGDVMGACPAVEPTIVICHKDASGNKSTISIPEFRWIEHFNHGDSKGECPRVEIPMMTICHQPAGGGQPQTIQIPATEWAIHHAHGDTQGACPTIVDNDIQICHYNSTTGKREQMIIKESQWPMHQAHGDTKGICPKDNDPIEVPQFITICHKDQVTGKTQTLNIAATEWAAHQAHGDFMGVCPKEKKITICHIPATGDKRQTIEIPESEWAIHQAHGDVMGACPAVEPTIVICHKDASGKKSTITIPEFRWVEHFNHGDSKGECPRVEVPMITICHQPAGGGQPQTIQIPATEWAIHQAHGDTKGVCPPQVVDKEIQICHYNASTGKREEMIIKESQWSMHQAHGDTKGICPKDNEPNDTPNKVAICHKDVATGKYSTIMVFPSEIRTHLAHGDIVGVCNDSGGGSGSTGGNGGNNGGNEQKMVICHYPPGNTGNPQTIEIPVSAWAAHQTHGDTQGACTTSGGNNGNGGNSGGNNNNSGGNNNNSGGSNNNSGGNNNGNSGNTGGGKKKITICHYPPGNTGNPQTIKIDESAWKAHQAHGDQLGPCPTSNKSVKQKEISKPKGKPGFKKP